MTPEAIRDEILRLVAQYHDAVHAPQPFVPGETPIHYAGRVFDERELQNLADASLEFWLTEGRYSRQLENALAKFIGVPNVILANSGSSANLLAISALKSERLAARALKPGDEVITAAAAFPSTVAPIIQCGLIPVFVDVSPAYYNPLPEAIEKAIGPRTRAVMLAHTMGNPFDCAAVMDIARRRDLWVIEDNCDALGSSFAGQRTGSFGHISTCSFYAAHHITTGEGGAVATRDETLARIVRSLRDWGRDCYCRGGEKGACGHRFSQQFGRLPKGYDHRYVYSHLGFNMRMTDLQASIGCVQMEKLPMFIEARKRNWSRLRAVLAPYAEWLILPEATPSSDPAWFGFVISVRDDAPFSRSDLVPFLESRKIETRPLFAGNLLLHPAYDNVQHRVSGSLDATERIAEQTFFIGCYPGLNDAHLDYIAAVFAEFFASRGMA